MNPRPEVIGDVNPSDGVVHDAVNELGLTADEQAEFDAMREGPADGDGSAEPEPAPDATPAPAPADPAAVVPPPAGEDDDDDEPAPEPKIDPKTGKPMPGRQVNYGKYKRTKDALAAEKQARDQERQDRIRLEERLNILNQALTAVPAAVADPAAAAPEAPKNPWDEPTIDVTEDAIAAVAQMQRRTEWNHQQGTRFQENVQETNDDQQLRSSFERDAGAFSSTPEGKSFGAAYNYLKDHRLTEMAITMFGKDPNDATAQFTKGEIEQLVTTFNAEEKWVVQNAVNTGQSPARAIMKLATFRGFKTPAADATQAPATTPPAAPTATAARQAASPALAAPAAPAARSVVQQIKDETAAAAASVSLSDGGGTPPPVVLTPEALVRMPEAEFQALVDRLSPAQLQSLMGKADDE